MSGSKAPATYSPFPAEPLVDPSTLVCKDGRRANGRRPEEIRDAFFRLGTVSHAAGSAYAEFESTKVMVAVYGPRASHKAEAFSSTGRLQCDVKIASFATQTRGRYGQGPLEREYSHQLQQALSGAVALHTFPKAAVDVFAIILQSGGADIAITITCASLALAAAGIEMQDIVAAVAISTIDGRFLLDPDSAEQSAEAGGALVACLPFSNEITLVMMRGEGSRASAAQAIEASLDACGKLGKLMRSVLVEHVQGTREGKE